MSQPHESGHAYGHACLNVDLELATVTTAYVSHAACVCVSLPFMQLHGDSTMNQLHMHARSVQYLSAPLPLYVCDSVSVDESLCLPVPRLSLCLVSWLCVG